MNKKVYKCIRKGKIREIEIARLDRESGPNQRARETYTACLLPRIEYPTRPSSAAIPPTPAALIIAVFGIVVGFGLSVMVSFVEVSAKLVEAAEVALELDSILEAFGVSGGGETVTLLFRGCSGTGGCGGGHFRCRGPLPSSHGGGGGGGIKRRVSLPKTTVTFFGSGG